ncbi:MAG: TIR domain-containing protein [Thermodesulfobacteriota bacterium]
MNKTRVFLSYSWDSEIHKEWVRKLADTLEELKELHVVWDGYDLDALTDKNKFMESGICTADYVIVIATKKYKEKADNRSGGVGIETYLASAAHWDGLQKQAKTKVIVVLREPDSVPNYLKGHLYVDFTADSLYCESEAKLLKYFRSESTVPRPPKRRSLASDEHLYTFTKIEDLIRVGHTNRRPIVNKEQGTNYSGSNRIKYELWETKSPTITYYLALANKNINITQTVNHAIGQFNASGIRPSDLIVLRPRSGRPDQALISGLFSQADLRTQIHEYTYKDYIWNFCIDKSLRNIDPPSEIANYTDQSLSYENDQSEHSLASARDFLVNLLLQPSTTSAHLVVASGGMGKTSLCLSVAAKLHNRHELHSSVILIQAESIKRYVADHGLYGARIDSVFQLYELYARHHHFDQVFDRNTFELAFLSGNLVVIIDGLDEFVSIFPETFNLDLFLASLDQFHRELGSSAVLLTTRNSQLVEHARLEELSIKRYDLLGFDKPTCEAYLRRRFSKYSNGQAIAARVQSQIDKVQRKRQLKRFFSAVAESGMLGA